MEPEAKKLSLSRRVAQNIEQKIVSGEFEPGSRLPAQRDLALSLGVSRTALREAISLLEARGLLRSLAGSGTYVAEQDNLAEQESGRTVTLKGNYSKLDFCRFRLAIEVPSIRLTSMNITDAEIDDLSTNLQSFKEAVRLGHFDRAATLDAAFHLFIVTAAGVELFKDLYIAFQHTLIDTIAMAPPLHSRGWEAVVEHERVLEAVKRRDPDEAVYYMKSHIIRSAQRLGFVLPMEIL